MDLTLTDDQRALLDQIAEQAICDEALEILRVNIGQARKFGL